MNNKSKFRYGVLIFALILVISLVIYTGTLANDKSKICSITFDNTRINEGNDIVGI